MLQGISTSTLINTPPGLASVVPGLSLGAPSKHSHKLTGIQMGLFPHESIFVLHNRFTFFGGSIFEFILQSKHCEHENSECKSKQCVYQPDFLCSNKSAVQNYQFSKLFTKE